MAKQEPEYVEILNNMYWTEVTDELRRRLERVNALAVQGGGSLRSRQIIANIILNYELDMARKDT